MSDTSRQRLLSHRELLAAWIAADGGETITVTLPVPVVAHIKALCRKCGRTPDDWLYQALLEQVQRQGDEIQRVLQHLRTQRPRNVPSDAAASTSAVIDTFDRFVNDRVAAADAAGDQHAVNVFLALKQGLKRAIEHLPPAERDLVAEGVLRELEAEVIP